MLRCTAMVCDHWIWWNWTPCTSMQLILFKEVIAQSTSISTLKMSACSDWASSKSTMLCKYHILTEICSDSDTKRVIMIILMFFSGFEEDPSTSKFEIYAKVDRLALLGTYKIRGNVIILPVVGNGASNLTFGMIFWAKYWTADNVFGPYSWTIFVINCFFLCLFLIDNVDVSIKLRPKTEVKKGKTYLSFDDVKLDFTTTR